ncbi:MAG: hypothetical protein ACP5US_12355 [Candidatus Kryptoniota bacterium]
MSVDLKLVKHLKGTRVSHACLARAQMVEQLRTRGNTENDIIDSYEDVFPQDGKPMGLTGAEVKSMAATVILSILIACPGHMYTGAAGIGVLILVLYFLLWLPTVLTFGIGGVIGIPLMIGVWLWGTDWINGKIREDK